MLRHTETGALDNLSFLGRTTHYRHSVLSSFLSLSLALQDRVSFVACAVLELRNLPNFVSLGLELVSHGPVTSFLFIEAVRGSTLNEGKGSFECFLSVLGNGSQPQLGLLRKNPGTSSAVTWFLGG